MRITPLLTTIAVFAALAGAACLPGDPADAAVPNPLAADCQGTKSHPAPEVCTFIPIDIDTLVSSHSLSFREPSGYVRTYTDWKGVYGYVRHRAPRCDMGGRMHDLKACWVPNEPGMGPSFFLSDGTGITRALFRR